MMNLQELASLRYTTFQQISGPDIPKCIGLSCMYVLHKNPKCLSTNLRGKIMLRVALNFNFG